MSQIYDFKNQKKGTNKINKQKKEIIKIGMEINEINEIEKKKKKQQRKSVKPKAGSLRRSIKLTNL